MADQTPDPTTPTIRNVVYGALSSALLDHGIHLEPYMRGGIRDEIVAAVAALDEEGPPGWEGCDRAEAIRQAEHHHAELLKWMDEHDRRRDERDAALADLRDLADGHAELVVHVARLRRFMPKHGLEDPTWANLSESNKAVLRAADEKTLEGAA